MNVSKLRELRGQIGNTFTGQLIDALLEDEEPKPARPEVGTQFWMRGTGESDWWVWTACEDGIETVDEGGLLNNGYSWEVFDDQINRGIWLWQPLEQPEEV